MPSVRCASTLPPNVAHAIACVSPRVKRELPCTRGSNPPSQVIGLTVFVSRPSCRRLLIRMESLIAWDSIRPHARRTSEDCVGDGKKGTVSDEEIGNTHNSAITQDEKPKTKKIFGFPSRAKQARRKYPGATPGWAERAFEATVEFALRPRQLGRSP